MAAEADERALLHLAVLGEALRADGAADEDRRANAARQPDAAEDAACCALASEAAGKGHWPCVERLLRAAGAGRPDAAVSALAAALRANRVECVAGIAALVGDAGRLRMPVKSARRLVALAAAARGTESAAALVVNGVVDPLALVLEAARRGRADIVGLLVRGAGEEKVEGPPRRGVEVARLASTCESMRECLSRHSGTMALTAAAASGSLATLQVLLAAGARVSDASLCAALDRDDASRACELLAPLLLRSRVAVYWMLPLHVAAARGNGRAVEMLLASGVQPHLPVVPMHDTGFNRTPLLCSVMQSDLQSAGGGALKAMTLLLYAECAAANAKAALLLDAVEAGDVRAAARNVGAANANARTAALLLATARGDANMLGALLAAGCDPSGLTSQREVSALTLAVRLRDVACVRVLVRAGARLASVEASGGPLANALLRCGRGVNARCDRGAEEAIWEELLAARRASGAGYEDASDGLVLVAAMLTGRVDALSALLGVPLAADVLKNRSYLLHRMYVNLPGRFPIEDEMVSLDELVFSGDPLPQLIQCPCVIVVRSHLDVPQPGTATAGRLVDPKRRRTASISLALAWVARACARLGDRDLLPTLMRSPLLRAHFAAAPVDVSTVLVAAMLSGGDPRCAERALAEVLRWPEEALTEHEVRIIVWMTLNRARRDLARQILQSHFGSKFGGDVQLLHPALVQSDVELFEELLFTSQGALRFRDKSDLSTLTYAIQLGRVGVIRSMLRLGFLPAGARLEGPLRLALLPGTINAGVAQLLIDHGADIFRTIPGTRETVFARLKASGLAALIHALSPWRVTPSPLDSLSRHRLYDPAVWRVVARYTLYRRPSV